MTDEPIQSWALYHHRLILDNDRSHRPSRSPFSMADNQAKCQYYYLYVCVGVRGKMDGSYFIDPLFPSIYNKDTNIQVSQISGARFHAALHLSFFLLLQDPKGDFKCRVALRIPYKLLLAAPESFTDVYMTFNLSTPETLGGGRPSGRGEFSAAIYENGR